MNIMTKEAKDLLREGKTLEVSYGEKLKITVDPVSDGSFDCSYDDMDGYQGEHVCKDLNHVKNWANIVITKFHEQESDKTIKKIETQGYWVGFLLFFIIVIAFIIFS